MRCTSWRDGRLMAEKLLSAEKERRKSEIVLSSAQRAAREHYEAHAAQELGWPFSLTPLPGDVIKGHEVHGTRWRTG